MLAARAGLSKGMLVEMERATTNPSLATLCRVANALGVRVPALVGSVPTAVARLIPAAATAILWRGRRGGVAQLLAGVDTPALVELWHWRLGRGEIYAADAHPANSREIVHVLGGQISVQVDGTEYRAGLRDTLVFQADKPHAYANRGRAVARFVMAVIEPTSRAAHST